MALIDTTYLASMMSAEDYARAFDRNGTGTVDTAYATRCIAVAESEAYLILNGGGVITVPLTGTVDEGVKVAIGRMAIYEAMRFHASDGASPQGKSPYRLGYEDSKKLLADLRADQMRFVTANDGVRAAPVASVTGVVNSDGRDGGPYSRTTTGRDVSGF